MAGKSEPETASDSPVRWTRMHHPPPISHPATLKKDTVYVRVSMCECVCVSVCVRVCAFLTLAPKSSHSHTYINTYTEQSFRNCHLFLTLFCMCYRKCSFQLFKISHSSKPPCLLPFGCRHST